MADRVPFQPSLYTILVVDDEEMNRDMLSRRLERKGYTTFLATGGTDAIERIDKTGPDLVLLDINMPGVSGFDVLRDVRKRVAPEELPIIMASARTDTEAITQCLEAGANDYVTKPLDFPVVLARIQTQLTMKAAVEGLKASEARFRLLAELSADMISLHGPDGRFRFVSPSCGELLGYSADELVGVDVFSLLHPKDREKLPATQADLPEACTLVLRMKRKDESWIWVEMKSRSLRGTRTGKVTDIQCSTRDVSFYVDAFAPAGAQSPPLPGMRSLPPHMPTTVLREGTQSDIPVNPNAPPLVFHGDHVVHVSAEPPPVRSRKAR